MTAFKAFGLGCGVALAAITVTGGQALALNLLKGKEMFPAEYANRIAEGNKGLEKLDNSDQAKGLYSKLVVWPPSFAKLRVCFLGGSDATNASVANVASTWNQVAQLSLKLDFGNAQKPRRCGQGRDSQIRVSYDKPGFWSLLGQYSIVYAAQEEASLNLEGMDQVDPNVLLAGEYKGVILHEFGHAFGMLHEHQSPVATCANEFNWDFIFKYLSGPPNNWDEETIKFNLVPYGGDDLMMTSFDPQSIMLYSFPAEYYLAGAKSNCYIGSSNIDISGADKATVEYMYPADVASRAQAFEQSKAQMQQIVDKAKESDATKSVSMNYMDAFFGAKGVAADEE